MCGCVSAYVFWGQLVCLFARVSESAAGGSVSVGRFVGQLSDERVVCVFVSVLCLQVCCVVLCLRVCGRRCVWPM